MQKKNQFYYYVTVYKDTGSEVYDPIGYLQKDGEIGYKNIFTTNKSMAEQLVKRVDSMGLCGVLCDIRDEEDENIKKELITLMNR